MAFRIGQKVVCVDDDWQEAGHEPPHPSEVDPVLGGIYTIRGIEGHADSLYFVLQEIVNPPRGSGNETWFEAVAFRPVVELKTDISIFTRMLKEKVAEVAP
jgi:hypothetical protein